MRGKTEPCGTPRGKSHAVESCFLQQRSEFQSTSLTTASTSKISAGWHGLLYQRLEMSLAKAAESYSLYLHSDEHYLPGHFHPVTEPEKRLKEI